MKNLILEARLEELQKECSAPDWDGYGGSPITKETVSKMKRLIELLPDTIMDIPHLVPEPSGSIALEWRKKKGEDFTGALVLSINSEGKIDYALTISACNSGHLDNFKELLKELQSYENSCII